MWNTESSRKAVLAEGRYVEAENGHCGRQKLSSGMAMVLGALLTMEIMLGGAMLFNFDFHGADIVAVVLSFMVLYFAVVASLTDKLQNGGERMPRVFNQKIKILYLMRIFLEQTDEEHPMSVK